MEREEERKQFPRRRGHSPSKGWEAGLLVPTQGRWEWGKGAKLLEGVDTGEQRWEGRMRRLQPTRLSHVTMSVPCPKLS